MLGMWKLFELWRKTVGNNQILCGFHYVIQISEKVSSGYDETCLPKQKNSFLLNSFFNYVFQSLFPCLKSEIDAVEMGVKYFQS